MSMLEQLMARLRIDQSHLHGRIQLLIWLPVIVLCLAVSGFTAATLYNLKQSTLREAEANLSRYSLTLAEQADRSFKSVDLLTLSLADYIGRFNLTTKEAYAQRLNERDVFDLLVEKLSGLPQVDAITVINEDGKLLNFSRYWPIPNVNVSDRDYFKALKSDPTRKTILSEPVENRGTGTWTIYLARRVDSPTGKFMGLVLGAMTLQYYEDFYRATAPNQDSAVSLYRADGKMLARYPKTDQIGKTFEDVATLATRTTARTIRSNSPIDNKLRLKAAQPLANFPLIILSTQTEESVLREWRGISRMMSIQTAGLIVIVLLAATLLSRWIYQQQLLRLAQVERDAADKARAVAEAELLREQSRVAEKANQAKSQFLAVMSHEMRTPLNGIIGALDLLQATPLAAEQTELVGSAMTAGEALLVQINDVLDFSKMEAGKLSVDYAPTDLRELLPKILTIIERQVQQLGNKLTVGIADNVPDFLSIDPVRVRQILLNLLSNANKFTQQGEIELTIGSFGDNADVPWIEFAVCDTGQGIPADRIDCLFKEFSMVDASYARNAGGTGLGLAICKRLVELMGGEIGVDSVLGQGSRFWFRLPLQVCTRPQELELVGAETASIAITPQHRFQILLVDDNGTNRFVAGKMLEALGHNVRTATDGAEAVAAARQSRFDIIFMDISMPEMDGLEATRRIRLLPPPFNDVPIVALTANAAAGDQAEFLANGMNAHLTKPIRKDDLAACLHRILTDPRAAKHEPLPSSAKPGVAETAMNLAKFAILDCTEIETLASETSIEFIPMIIAEFASELRRRLDEYDAALTMRDRQLLSRVSHAIAGGAASVGALRLRHLAKTLEAAWVKGDEGEVDQLSARLHPTAEETLSALTAYLQTVAEIIVAA